MSAPVSISYEDWKSTVDDANKAIRENSRLLTENTKLVSRIAELDRRESAHITVNEDRAARIAELEAALRYIEAALTKNNPDFRANLLLYINDILESKP